MLSGPRIRQVALVASDGGRVARELREAFDWPEPFNDPGVGEFGLANFVFEVGDTFVEVVTPVADNTTAGRYLERRGADAGYMAIFQVPDLAAARARVDALGVRVVWSVDVTDMATIHLHPRDVPGAIVSLDWASPEGSWRWAGPRWAGRVPADVATGGIVSVGVEVPDPVAAARRWCEVLGDVTGDGAEVTLPARQCLSFSPMAVDGVGAITSVTIAGPAPVKATIGGVHFTIEEAT